jgi:serine phosphatase RsbU (regulator of sigma subunit)
VSGDFYWHYRINLEGLQAQSPGSLSEELIVVGDCTGHGVPGAFMSMIGNTLLNEIVNVKKIHSPPEILSQLNKGVFDLLHQGNSDSETQDDGMDITILKINHRKPELEYAAANHFSYLVTNNQLEKLKGDIYSIGGMLGSSGIQYQSRKIKYKTGSAVYLFTDGYIDQFGGEKGNKYTAMRFETILKDISAMDMSRQKELLVDEFQNWKRENKQIDDILVLGIRL